MRRIITSLSVNTTITVAFYNGKANWKDRIRCPCNRFRTTGVPCIHAALVIVRIHNDHASARIQSVRDVIAEKQDWKEWSPLWYAPIYHLASYVKQYTFPSLECHAESNFHNVSQLFPMAITAKGGRRAKGRKVRHGDRAQANLDKKDDGEEVSSDSSAEEFLLNLERLPTPGSIKTTSTLRHCSKCGSTGHYADRCATADISYMVSHSKLTAQVLSHTSTPHLVQDSEVEFVQASSLRCLRLRIGSSELNNNKQLLEQRYTIKSNYRNKEELDLLPYYAIDGNNDGVEGLLSRRRMVMDTGLLGCYNDAELRHQTLYQQRVSSIPVSIERRDHMYRRDHLANFAVVYHLRSVPMELGDAVLGWPFDIHCGVCNYYHTGLCMTTARKEVVGESNNEEKLV